MPTWSKYEVATKLGDVALLSKMLRVLQGSLL